jgi:hypothetical protein
MSLNDTVKRIAAGYIGSLKLSDAVFGTVQQINPLEVNVDQRLTLDEDFLVVPEHLTEHKVTVGGQEIPIRRGLEIGDKIVMVRQHGGLNFVVVGRLPS